MENQKIVLLTLCLLCGSLGLIAQRTVTGTVTDKSGELMIGVNILEKGTSNGASTGVDGKYSINVIGSDPILEFSYTGYKTVEVTVGAKSVIDLVIEENSEVIDELVVSALGFKQNKDESQSNLLITVSFF